MSWNTFFAFVVTEAVLSLTPGPAVLLIVSQGLTRSARHAAWGTAGILSANAFYFLLSALGLGALLLSWPPAFAIARWCSIAYLAWIGLGMVASRPTAEGGAGERGAPEQGRTEAVPAEGGAASATRPGRGDFLEGAVLQVSNPKAILYFLGVLPQFISPDRDVRAQFAILGATSIVVEAVILLAYGLFASSARRWAGRERGVALQKRLSGACLCAIAVWLAIDALMAG